MTFVCLTSDLHPYECDGPGKCLHCDRSIIVANSREGTNFYEHHPDECELCKETAQ